MTYHDLPIATTHELFTFPTQTFPKKFQPYAIPETSYFQHERLENLFP